MAAALSNALVVAVLATPVWGVTRLARLPALTHALWLLLLAKLVTPPLVQVPLPWTMSDLLLAIESPGGEPTSRRGVARGSELTRSGQGVGPPVMGTSFPGAGSGLQRTVGSTPAMLLNGLRCGASWCWWPALLASLWTAGSLVQLAGVWEHVARFRRCVSELGRVDMGFQSDVERIARQLGLRTIPRARLIEQRVSPMLWGAGTGVYLLFPRGLWETLPNAQRDSLLMHELGHFKRFDPWVRLLEVVCSVLYWWHPVVWWGRRAIETAAEECCDALVLNRGASPRTYALAIVSTLDFLSERVAPLPPLASSVSPVPALRTRLTQIMQRSVDPRLPPATRWCMWGGCLATLALHPLLAANPASPRHDELPSVESETIVPQPADRKHVDMAASPKSPPTVDRGSVAARQRTDSDRVATWRRNPDPPHMEVISPDGDVRLVVEPGRFARLEAQDASKAVVLDDANICCAAYVPSGKRLVTGGVDGMVRVWDTQTGVPLARLGPWAAPVVSVAVDPQGQTAATGSRDGSAVLWDLATGSIRESWTASRAAVVAVRYSPDGELLAIAAVDGRFPLVSHVLLLDARTLRPTEQVTIPLTAAAAHFEATGFVRVADAQGNVVEWDIEPQALNWRPPVSSAAVSAAAFSPQMSL